MVNKAILIGRLGQDPDVRYTNNGTPVANFSIATDEKGKNGQQVTTWHNIVAWSKLAEVCQKYLKKGALVFIEGKIQHSKYEDRDGNKRDKTEIVAQGLRMLGGDKDSDADPRAPRDANQRTKQNADPLKKQVWQKMKRKRLGRDESEYLWSWAMERGYSPKQLLEEFDDIYEIWMKLKTADPALPDDDDIPF